MTDQEIICTFMEPRPPHIDALVETPSGGMSPTFIPYLLPVWWSHAGWTGSEQWIPIRLTLDRLREVEERLTEEQWVGYIGHLLLDSYDDLTGTHKRLVNASAAQKVKALAAVLRSDPALARAEGKEEG